MIRYVYQAIIVTSKKIRRQGFAKKVGILIPRSISYIYILILEIMHMQKINLLYSISKPYRLRYKSILHWRKM